MNPKFYQLPQGKQRRIVNAGYQVFSEHPYRNAPMSEIAAAANISKSLLFHYFHNKLELYSCLWNHCVQVTFHALQSHAVLDTTDFFEMLRRSTEAKCHVMETYPFLWAFSMRAYYEQDAQIRQVVRPDFVRRTEESLIQIRERINLACLKPGIPLDLIYQEILWASEGYMYTKYLSGQVNPSLIRADFEHLIRLWETAYGRSAP